jgi:hypothetical protein
MDADRYAELIAEKAWDALGMTAQEFLTGYYGGHFRESSDQKVKALVFLVEQGYWPGDLAPPE